MSEVPKWSCDYCTYQNFQASKKCVLCRAAKPVKLITEATVAGLAGPSIYELAEAGADGSRSLTQCTSASCASHNPYNLAQASSNRDGVSKWRCESCTYLNWPRSLRCVQCLTNRPRSPGLLESGSRVDRIPDREAGVISDCGPRSPRRSDLNQRNISPTSPEETKELNNDKNRSLANAWKLGKWTCRACTYENWPKSIKCVICGTNRSRTPEAGASGGLDSADCEQRLLRSRQGSPCIFGSASQSSSNENLAGATAASTKPRDKSRDDDRMTSADRLLNLRPLLNESDWLWLNACNGVLDSDIHAVEAYICSGGDPGRQLTSEESHVLNKPGVFERGYTLIHLAVRMKRDDILAALLTSTEVATKAIKRVPCHMSPDIAASIQREVASSLRQRKGDFPCFFLTECPTFILPAEIEDLPSRIQTQLFDELIDRDVQQELEVEDAIINWNLELTGRLGSRLLSLWNRTAGDCLLDSVMQATWGIFDRENALRRSLSDSLTEGAVLFYPRWKEFEAMQANSLHFSLDENQWQQDWAVLLSLASQPGASLEQAHVFALAHILRRPIIIYGVKFVKSFRGEIIGYAGFQGVYLPLLWEQSFCWKTPITLGYTRGHFSALVPLEQDNDCNIGATNNDSDSGMQTYYLPLVDSEGKLLQVHFLAALELGREESILKEWLDCCVTEEGVLVATMKVRRRHGLVRHMTDEWLDYYRRLAHNTPPAPPSPAGRTPLSSEAESDDE